MSKIVYTGFTAIVTGNAAGDVHHNVDMLCEDGWITAIAPGLADSGLADSGLADSGVESVVDCTGLIAYPGLVNTHHHFFQACVRNLGGLDWTQLGVIEWLDRIYPIFARLTEDCFYHSTLVSLADLVKHGCTTAFDHQYCFPRHAGTQLVDRQFEAAELLGVRLHVGRGCNTLARSEGSTIPDEMRETTDEFIADCERLITHYHDASAGSMKQIVIAPCQPVNSLPETFIEAAQLARQHGVALHTHLGEGETGAMLERHGVDSIQWCADHGFLGEDVWLAHGWEFGQSEIARLAETNTGISHCPTPVMLVGESITQIPQMADAGLRISLGVDGQASNDAGNLAECIRLAYLLQCLNAEQHEFTVPSPYEFMRIATAGGASCLRRNDIGELTVGKAADFFAIDGQRLDLSGATHSPKTLPAKVGLTGPAEMTVCAGKAIWYKGEFPGHDERELAVKAQQTFNDVLGDVAVTYGDAVAHD